MRTLVYDCPCGLSGDMNLGALVDLGVPEDHLRTELAKLDLADEFSLSLERTTKQGIAGTLATVSLIARHDGSSEHDHAHHHSRPHGRRLSDIVQILEASALAAATVELAAAIFRTLAVAEAKVHAIEIEDVHFHEVGATDAIVDIVAAAVCLQWLGVARVECRHLELGSGTVRCAHGVMPVPAPATAEMLQGVACSYGAVDGECTTPTGAAILKTTVNRFPGSNDAPQRFTCDKIGYGLGQRDFEIPNVARVMLGTTHVTAANTPDAIHAETNHLLECNLDDMSGEALVPLQARLFDAGAVDVYFTPVTMKKNRPGVVVSALAPTAAVRGVRDALFAHSTTIGIRETTLTKWRLPRREVTAQTTFGSVRGKVSELPDGQSRIKAEYDDVAAISEQHQIPFEQVKTAAERALRDVLDEEPGA